MSECNSDEMTTSEVMAYLEIGRTTLYKRIKEEVLKPIKSTAATRKPARLKFKRADVERVKREGVS